MIKPVAFYLPQFHRIPENDRWWGEGFTEWTRVDAARPLFPGHAQPQVPAPPLGHYDLTDRETRLRQGEMARAHGIHAFCYYHYWFGGKRLLEGPLERMLADGAPALPFMLAWANEPWTRRWDGMEHDVLQPQEYGDAHDWSRHFDLLLRFFADPRYVRVDGCPVFLVYRAGHIPCLADMLALWRARAREAGLPGLHLVGMLTSFDEPPETFARLDAVCELFPSWPRRLGLDGVHLRGVRVSGARQAWRIGLDAPRLHRVQYRGAFASWDNTPRLGERGYAFVPLSPDELRERLAEQCRRTRADAALPAPFLFFNAWNEWAEGCHLEPDTTHGAAWLEAVRDVVRGCEGAGAAVPAIAPPVAPLSRARFVRVDDGDVRGAMRVPPGWTDASAIRIAAGHPCLRAQALEAEALVLGTIDAELVDIACARHGGGRPTFVDLDAVMRRSPALSGLTAPLARLRLDLLGHVRGFASLLDGEGSSKLEGAHDQRAQLRLGALLEGGASASSVLGLIDLADHHAGWLLPLRQAARQLNDLREPREAARVLQRVFAVSESDGEARCELARSLHLGSHVAEAQALLMEVVAQAPWLVLGWQYLLRMCGSPRAGAADAARDAAVAEVARRAVESQPHNYALGMLAAATCGSADGGRLLLRVMESLAASLHPSEKVDAALFTGKTVSDLGAAWICADPSAIEALRIACRLFPASARVADVWARVLWGLGEQAEALETWARADTLRRTHAAWAAAQR